MLDELRSLRSAIDAALAGLARLGPVLDAWRAQEPQDAPEAVPATVPAANGSATAGAPPRRHGKPLTAEAR